MRREQEKARTLAAGGHYWRITRKVDTTLQDGRYMGEL